jgi:hypothetical protein
MVALNRESVFQRAPNLEVQIDSANNVIRVDGRLIEGGPASLAILDAFYSRTAWVMWSTASDTRRMGHRPGLA